VHYSGGFRIVIKDHEKKHVGLGSTGSVLLALGHAMNAILGSPLSSEQIRILLGHNYVEETEDGRVTNGFELVWDRLLRPTAAWSLWATNWLWPTATDLPKARTSS